MIQQIAQNHFIKFLYTSNIVVPLPFKDQKSANSVKREMQNLSAKIGVQIKPVFQSKKISQVLSPKEKKPPIVNKQCVVYKFQCDLCDTDYVGYTTRHLHQRIGEHKYSVIGRHLEDHGLSKSDLKDKHFSVMRKCRSKFDCLIFEMLFIKELKPGLNTQKDSVRAKLFTRHCVQILSRIYLYIFIFKQLFLFTLT